ncbi:MAG: hypothetical protein KDJ75_07750 [Alphaproteobacteria bacterium]|nr:hypothetical protein [Alphaproteobacteria bacterium]
MSALSKFTLIFCFLAFLPLQAHAGEPRLMGRYGDWEAYVFSENGNKVCYMATQPKKREGNYTKRGESFLLITHRPAEGARNVFSYITGYTYKPGSDASAKIGSKKFLLFTQDDTAWGPDAETDESLTASIRKGSNMIITGTSSRGTQTTDTVSLKGSGKAYDEISKECPE